MAQTTLHTLTATDVQERVNSGDLTLEDYVKALLARYSARDEDVKAWTTIHPDSVLEQAKQLDSIPSEKRGRLHGFVIGVKDIIITKG